MSSESAVTWRLENPERYNSYHRQWRAENKTRLDARVGALSLVRKIVVFSYYGPSRVLQCSWPGCRISDMDMLTLDHIDNNGNADRKVRGLGQNLYRTLIKEGFPIGFQTLCHNHQWKKEMARRKT
jgi:hypothetical protein